MPRTNPPGSSLTDATIVVAVVAILLTTSPPFLRGALRTRNVVVTAQLRNVMQAELRHFEEHGSFTADRAALLAIDPGLALGDTDDPGSIFIDVSHSKVAPALCLFAEGSPGEWQTLYYSGAIGSSVELRSPNECARRMIEEHRDPHRYDWRSTPATRAR